MYYLSVLRVRGPKIKVSRAAFLSIDFTQSTAVPFPISEVARSPWLTAPSSVFKAKNGRLNLSDIMSL